MPTTENLIDIMKRRILVLDGAMGTMIQRRHLQEEDYRAARFSAHPSPLKGCNDLLNLTRPTIIREIHRAYLEAGADILETNTFNATSIAMEDYDLTGVVFELNRVGAELAHVEADAMTRMTPEKPRYVAGVLGPTSRTATISPDVNDPSARNVTYDELVTAYKEATRGLIAGNADIILIETVFDTLNAKAAIFAVDAVFEEDNVRLPVMISGTITDASGRTLTGQTTSAFYNSIRHANGILWGIAERTPGSSTPRC